VRAALLACLFALAACGAVAEGPAVDAGEGCDADPCELVACPTAPDGGNTHVRDDVACSCSCSLGWPR